MVELQEFPEDTVDFLGGVKWSSKDEKATVSAMLDAGPEKGFTGEHNRVSLFLVGTYQFTEQLWWGSGLNVGSEEQGSFITKGANANWWGFEQEVTYKLDPKFGSACLRIRR